MKLKLYAVSIGSEYTCFSRFYFNGERTTHVAQILKRYLGENGTKGRNNFSLLDQNVYRKLNVIKWSFTFFCKIILDYMRINLFMGLYVEIDLKNIETDLFYFSFEVCPKINHHSRGKIDTAVKCKRKVKMMMCCSLRKI